MSLSPGTRLGPYEILTLVGAGGMGEVYRARDTKLGRDVAIKVLPESFANDVERLARFQREAQVLASLNHPSIAHIHGIEDAGGMRALVMELVDGDTLTVRLQRGPVPLAEALALARQIADALEAAHERGIVHRDLKPANIVVTHDGAVKVLDFGLAKTTSGFGPSSDSSQSPTLTVLGTRDGVILGTAAYMSPEQARGRPVDKRADLWAFGAVLYEMLAGRPLIEGEDVSEILAHILTKEPDWHRLPPNTPVAIRRLLRRCLDKDKKRRLDSAAVARLEIDDALSFPSADDVASSAFPWRRAAPWAISAAVVTGLIAVGVARALTPGPAAPAPTSRFAIVLPPTQLIPSILLDRDLALSPDGRYLVYRVGGSVGGGPLALRRLDQLDAHLLPGIDNARAPFFSPDGLWVGFIAGTELRKISIAGGPAMTIRGNVATAASPSWGDDDTIAFVSSAGLLRVSAAGGEPTVIARFDENTMSGFNFTSTLPGGRGVLFTIKSRGTWFTGSNDSQVVVVDFETGQRKTLIRGGSSPQYVPTSARSGYLLYAAGETLFAARFDLGRLELRGDPVPVVEHIAMAPSGAANYDVSRTGTLVYVPAGAAGSRSLVWVDRAGHETPTKVPPHAYALLRLSPDGTQVVLADPTEHRIWIWDVARETLRALTFGGSEDGFPIWTPDSRSIIFNSNRDGAFNLYSQLADGSGPVKRLTTSPIAQFPNSMTRDGRQILGAEFTAASLLDIVVFSAPSSPSEAAPASTAMPFATAGYVVRTPAVEYDAIVSPDNRFFAYQSTESGRAEIYVKPFPPSRDVRWQASTGGGTSPVWSPHRRELYYRDIQNAVVAVPFETDGMTWQAGTPVKVLDPKYAAPTDMFNYDMSPDGERFLMLKEATAADQTAAPTQMVAVLNWIEELKQRVPTK